MPLPKNPKELAKGKLAGLSGDEKLAARLTRTVDFRVTTRPMLSLFSFRHEPKDITDLDEHNLRLINAINDD